MITREDYIKLRDNNQMSVQLAYEYYCLKTEEPLSFQLFSSYFSDFYALYHPDFTELYQYYDNKFNVTFVVDTQKQIVLKVF